VTPIGGKSWFTAAELADLGLPGLSRAKRKINERAAAERWALKVDEAGLPLARPRAGRGGGLEYNIALLPPAARLALAKSEMSGVATVTADAPLTPASLWPWYEGQSAKVKAEAQRRMAVVSAVERYVDAGLTRSAAVACAGGEHKVSPSTLWTWLQLVAGCSAMDWLPHLAPRRVGGGAEAAIDAEAWTFLISLYLRPEKPTFSSCYYRMAREFAAPRGLAVPNERTLRRKLERDVDPRIVISRRSGADALRATIPHQQRTVAQLHALELVNIDGHKWDVFVRFPDGKIRRPIMIGIQDVFSRKLLAWRMGETEDAVLTRLAFADLFRDYGIPKACLLDNGRAFASKWITGGADTRFRFKIRAEEPLGVLTQLGIATHWALPYRGSSKPIERCWKDFCDAIAKHPAFAGAYTGNNPMAKPENYGDKAVDWDVFAKVVSAGIAAHNAKPKRRTEMCRGIHSFDEVFAASYAAAPIGKATDEHLRLALLTADDRSTDRRSGMIELAGNRYWTQELAQIAGSKVTVRFDPDDLTKPIHVYSRDGRFLVTAPVIEQTGFLDMGAAKQRARDEANLKKATKAMIAAEQLLDANALAALLPDHCDEVEIPEPRIVRPVRPRGHSAVALKPQSDAAEPVLKHQPIDRMAAAASRLRLV
jgi:transposase InsO family protein